MKFKIWMLFVVLCSQGLDARYFGIKHEKQFFDEINNHEFVVACFLNNPNFDNDFDKKLKKDVNLLRDTVKAAADTQPFNKLLKKEVGFLVIDASKEEMQSLVDTYKIPMNGKPQFLLFKDGKALNTMAGQLAKLVGFISKADLLDFMGDYFGKEFDDILAKKSDEQAQEREMQLARYQAAGTSRYPYGSWAPYNPWGSPAGYIYTGYAAFYPYGYSYNGYAYFLP
ncbi:hypothetical protein KBC04_02795 [Candidatus Babeliales bacterium]|nr:hypothetical protein [Candidatus Babeliales bacterium]MBP9844019.1 hypothetical protein [Candidatus Babeliales bacterium]